MKPELLLHVGHKKTGSTTLQSTFAASAPALLARGVLYPRAVRGASHAWLVLPLDFERQAPRLILRKFRGDAALAHAAHEREWAHLADQIQKTRPEKVVLSTEYLVDRLTPDLAPAFRDRLATLFSKVTVVAYVRQPSLWYFSNLQQHLRYQDDLLPPAPVALRADLEVWEKTFPGAVRVRPYDRAQLVGGDIVADFLQEILGMAPDSLTLNAPRRTNEGLSAEGAQLIQDFRRAVCPGFVGRSLLSSNFHANLRRSEPTVPQTAKARLRPEVAAWLDAASVDLLWLRDRYGVVFPQIDYATIAPRDPLPGPARQVRDVALVDEARLKLLRRKAFRRAPWLWLIAALRR